jgi:hypothetical protein
MAQTPPKKRLKLHVRLGLLAVAYVLCVNGAVRHFGADSFPLSVVRLPEKTWALFALGLHSVRHVWSSDCAAPLPFIREAALAEGIPVPFALAIARAESGFRSHSISSTGAMGLMQLMPQTARKYGVLDAFDPEDNARGAARFLSELWKYYHGDRLRIAAAYNAGSGRVPRGRGQMHVPSSTLGYAARVVRHDRRNTAEALRQPVLLTER